MGTVLFHILFVAVGAVVGAIAGWLLRGGVPVKVVEVPVAAPPEKKVDQIESVVARLHQLASSVAADVGEHSHKVQTINQELTSGADVVGVIERLIKANEQMESQLQAAEQRLQEQASAIESHMQEARTDGLTKLANRRAFDDEIRHCVELFREKGQPSCLMMIDVDRFKSVNDTYGHQAGDEVLVQVSRSLRREAGSREVICRYGGEEFAIIYPGMSAAEVLPAAEKTRAAIAQLVIEFQGLDLRVTSSAGVAQLQTQEDSDLFVKRADTALYAGKKNGRNRGYWHDGSSCRPVTEMLAKMAAEARAQAEAAEAAAKQRLSPPAAKQPAPVFRASEVLDNAKSHRRDKLAELSDLDAWCSDIDRHLAEAARKPTANSLLLIAVDQFKAIAEQHGSKPAEVVWKSIVQLVKAEVRGMDHAARCDDNMVGILLPGTGINEACEVAERVRVAAEQCPVMANGEQLAFTVSLGVTGLQTHDVRETVLERAQRALMTAVSAGGNRTLVTSANGQCRETTTRRDSGVAGAGI